jgi:hypothetical protein
MAYENKMTHKSGWEWVEQYMKSDTTLCNMVNAYQVARDTATQYKFGLEVPRSPKHALEIDKSKDSTKWTQSMKAEIDQINEFSTFQVLPDHERIPPGYKRIPYHLVFDVKVDGRLKSRLVAGGHRTDPPKEHVFSGVVSMEAVHLGFLLA